MSAVITPDWWLLAARQAPKTINGTCACHQHRPLQLNSNTCLPRHSFTIKHEVPYRTGAQLIKVAQWQVQQVHMVCLRTADEFHMVWGSLQTYALHCQ